MRSRRTPTSAKIALWLNPVAVVHDVSVARWHVSHVVEKPAAAWLGAYGLGLVSVLACALVATVAQPNVVSRLCLSCHDGTIALGAVNTRPTAIEFAGGVTRMPLGPGMTLPEKLACTRPLESGSAMTLPFVLVVDRVTVLLPVALKR